VIRIRGARQNNLQNVDLDLPTNQLVVVTGVSGSGKSSLVFDTLYAEGQRRYIETFSAYARQFLDRMDKPQVDHIDGVPAAIAIDQTNTVRNSRSTVGTMTQINDHLKLLYARAGTLRCRQCAAVVRRDSPQSATQALLERASESTSARAIVTFPVPLPLNFSEEEVQNALQAQGYTRIHGREQTRSGEQRWHVVQDRLRLLGADRARVSEAFEAAFRLGQGEAAVYFEGVEQAPLRFSNALTCATCAIEYEPASPGLFSFNSPLGACETCRGFGRVIGVDWGLVVPDPRLSLAQGAIKVWQSPSFADCQQDLMRLAKGAGVATDIAWGDLPADARAWVLQGAHNFSGDWKREWYGASRFFEWLEGKAYKMHIRVLLSRYRAYTPCAACGGTRLKPQASHWRIAERTIHELMQMPIDRLAPLFSELKLPASLEEATGLLIAEIRSRLHYLQAVGLGYLTLDRQSRTLSGGEVQRIHLTTALGTSLTQTLFVLDEPSIGLHPRDLQRIVTVMRRLRDAGNSLVVVEHDPQILLAADHIVDIGPGPGKAGGRVLFEGRPEQLARASTPTGDWLGGRKTFGHHDAQRRAVDEKTPKLILEGARAHNLRNLSLTIPLQRLVVFSGVSGSGKSTLMQDVLLPALLKAKGKASEGTGELDRLLGDDWLDDVIFVDQSPIGRTTRSHPASHVGAFDAIRKRFAKLPLAVERGYGLATFSGNTGDGRCPSCSGNGFEQVEMQFLADVYLRCEACNGRRYREEILAVKLPCADGVERSIADVLELTVAEALVAFANERDVLLPLRPLATVGLEYLRLGQPVPTLSGGEAQRLKLAGYLAERKPARKASNTAPRGTLYLFDEPTTGLHFEDTARLLEALRALVRAGHSVLIIEHNLDVIAAADWVIDLGPEGGEGGGELVAAGTPATLAEHPQSFTGAALRDYTTALQGLTARAATDEAGVDHPVACDSDRVGTAPEDHAGEEEAGADDAGVPLQTQLRARAQSAIVVHRAREHNLKNIEVDIQRGALTVVTGPSGSGKSTLAFDLIFGEGQRRYLESLNAYARQFVQPGARPDVDHVFGVPPAVAIEQRTSRGGRKSTVATLTEIHHYLRLLYLKLGTQTCPRCQIAITPQSLESIVAHLLSTYNGQSITVLAPLVTARKGLYGDLAKWARGKGFGHLRVDGEWLPVQPWRRLERFVEHTIELPVAQLVVTEQAHAELKAAVQQALEYGNGVLGVLHSTMADVLHPTKADELAPVLFSTRRACTQCATSFAELDPRLFSFNSRHGWCTDCLGTGLRTDPKALAAAQRERERAKARGTAPTMRQFGDDEPPAAAIVDELTPCASCQGARLNPIALAVRLDGQSIAQLCAQTSHTLLEWLARLQLDARAATIAQESLDEIAARLRFLRDVGLGYLRLDRSAPTLSGGEAQRIRLAAQLGSTLQGVCYVLDEPTIGLHPRDNRVLLDLLDTLRGRGNTLVVVEHDEETIRRADQVIDLGPGAGREGGEIVAQGVLHDLLANAEALAERSATVRCLHTPAPRPSRARRPVVATTPSIVVRNAHLHNLAGVDARFPLARLSVVTGVSGSGKSTLARDVLLSSLVRRAQLRREGEMPKGARSAQASSRLGAIGCDRIEGDETIGRVLEVDQSPIGKTSRSCPATYIGFWDEIRKRFADTSEARLRGFAAGRFSFNAGEGRCATCDGAGRQRIEMNFLPDVQVLCEGCGGLRFNRETLAVNLRGKSIGDVLAMSVDEALEHFAAHASIRHPLQLLQDVGLGYLTLGQPSPMLSGGEAQRIKLVSELAKARPDAEATVYVLDEPTTGLHLADVERLIGVLHRLVDAGHTVIVIEHDLDLWAEADWLIDLGPEGGDEGGRIVAMDTPEGLVQRTPDSHTARVLEPFLTARAPKPRLATS